MWSHQTTYNNNNWLHLTICIVVRNIDNIFDNTGGENIYSQSGGQWQDAYTPVKRQETPKKEDKNILQKFKDELSGVDFTNVLLKAFTHTDPKIEKIQLSHQSFLRFWDLRA